MTSRPKQQALSMTNASKMEKPTRHVLASAKKHGEAEGLCIRNLPQQTDGSQGQRSSDNGTAIRVRVYPGKLVSKST
jgi:hypothetical protein